MLSVVQKFPHKSVDQMDLHTCIALMKIVFAFGVPIGVFYFSKTSKLGFKKNDFPLKICLPRLLVWLCMMENQFFIFFLFLKGLLS